MKMIARVKLSNGYHDLYRLVNALAEQGVEIGLYPRIDQGYIEVKVSDSSLALALGTLAQQHELVLEV